MQRSVNYDAIAGAYDRRYEQSDYGPVLRLLLDFAGGGKSVLEIGCGTGQWLVQLAKAGCDVVGLDPSRDMLKIAMGKSRQLGLVQGCAESIPFGTGTIDRLFCINAFHHFSGQDRFMAEVGRVLRHGGGMLIVGLDPHTGLDRWWIYDYFPQVIGIDKRRYPSTGQIRNLMAAGGFIRVSTAEALHMPVRMSARLALESGRLAKTTTSQLALLADDEYDEGVRHLMRDIEDSEGRGRALTIEADLRLYVTTGWLK